MAMAGASEMASAQAESLEVTSGSAEVLEMASAQAESLEATSGSAEVLEIASAQAKSLGASSGTAHGDVRSLSNEGANGNHWRPRVLGLASGFMEKIVPASRAPWTDPQIQSSPLR